MPNLLSKIILEHKILICYPISEILVAHFMTNVGLYIDKFHQ